MSCRCKITDLKLEKQEKHIFLRKLIREYLENMSNNVVNSIDFDYQNILQKDILYLKEFEFKKFSDKEGKKMWKFTFKSNSDNYFINFYIVNRRNEWLAKSFIYWKKQSIHQTPNSGKDAEQVYGPYEGYEDFKKHINRILTNSPLVSTKNYHDDWQLNMDEQAMVLLKRLKSFGKELEEMKNHVNFKDLAKVYHEIKNFKTDKEFMDFADKKAPEEGAKQIFILELQKMDKLGFYLDMAKMYHN